LTKLLYLASNKFEKLSIPTKKIKIDRSKINLELPESKDFLENSIEKALNDDSLLEETSKN